MDSATTPVKHYAMYGGMDAGSEPHLIAENKWLLQHNVRVNGGLRQVDRHRQLFSMTAYVDAVVNLSDYIRDYGAWVLVARDGVYRATQTGVTLVEELTESASPFSTHVYNGRVYFVNPSNRVRYTDGGSVYEVFEARKCWTKPTDEELIGNGPFTGHPLYVENVLTGHLGHFFNWVTDDYYRVYVERPTLFPIHSVLSIRDRRVDETDRFLLGRVVQVHSKYVVVRATNTQAGVTNVGLYTDLDPDPPRLVSVDEMPVPAGRYVTTFFDHLVIGAPMFNGVHMPHRTIWSGLYDFSQWVPNSDNEADGYTHSEYERADDIVKGVTGLAHFGEMLLIFTPSCIYAMEYTGLPRVVRVAPLIKDFGNGLPYASAELHNSVVWCDVHHGSFFAFRGQGPENIGQPIADYFFADVTNDSAWLRLTKAVVDRKHHEVLWLYCSKANTSGGYDKAVVYDYTNNAWSTRYVEDISAIGMLNKRAKAVNAFTGTINSNTTIVNEASASGEQLADVVAGKYLARTALSTDTEAQLDDQDAPVLETGDLIYGSLQTIKEVSSLWIDADGSVFNGLLVSVSTREFIDDDVVYTTVGLWTKTLEERVLTFAPIVGRILRYKFVPVLPVRDFVFRGFEDNVFNVNSSR